MTHNDINYKELFFFGWNKTKEHFWFILGVAAISILIDGLASLLHVESIFSFLVTIAITSVLLDIVHGHTPRYKDLLKPFKNHKITWHYLLATALIFLALGVCLGIGGLSIMSGSIVATTIVGIIFACAALYATVRLQFFKYFIVEHENLGPIEAFRKSYAITDGRFWQLLGVICVVIIFNLLGLLALVVGLLFTVPVTAIAYTHLYKKLSTSHHA